MKQSNTTAERIAEVLRLAIAKGIVTNQKEFAVLIGATPSQLTNYLKGNTTPQPQMLDKMNSAVGDAFNADWLRGGYGNMYAHGSTIQVGDNNTTGIPAKKFENEQGWFTLVAEKDKQIDRLLSIIENMQK